MHIRAVLIGYDMMVNEQITMDSLCNSLLRVGHEGRQYWQPSLTFSPSCLLLWNYSSFVIGCIAMKYGKFIKFHMNKWFFLNLSPSLVIKLKLNVPFYRFCQKKIYFFFNSCSQLFIHSTTTIWINSWEQLLKKK